MDGILLFLRVVLSLAAVFGLLLYLRRKFSTRLGTPGSSLLSVVQRQALGPKSSAVLIDVEGRRYLLGVSEAAVNVIDSYDAPAAAQVAESATQPGQPAAGPVLVDDLPDGEQDRDTPPAAPTRKSLRAVNAFEAELRRSSQASTRPGMLSGSILDVQTWRDAQHALRRGPRR